MTTQLKRQTQRQSQPEKSVAEGANPVAGETVLGLKNNEGTLVSKVPATSSTAPRRTPKTSYGEVVFRVAPSKPRTQPQPKPAIPVVGPVEDEPEVKNEEHPPAEERSTNRRKRVSSISVEPLNDVEPKLAKSAKKRNTGRADSKSITTGTTEVSQNPSLSATATVDPVLSQRRKDSANQVLNKILESSMSSTLKRYKTYLKKETLFPSCARD
ncbi:hypothetical protein BGZ65_011372, partial [Modicella reniformis]